MFRLFDVEDGAPFCDSSVIAGFRRFRCHYLRDSLQLLEDQVARRDLEPTTLPNRALQGSADCLNMNFNIPIYCEELPFGPYTKNYVLLQEGNEGNHFNAKEAEKVSIYGNVRWSTAWLVKRFSKRSLFRTPPCAPVARFQRLSQKWLQQGMPCLIHPHVGLTNPPHNTTQNVPTCWANFAGCWALNLSLDKGSHAPVEVLLVDIQQHNLQRKKTDRYFLPRKNTVLAKLPLAFAKQGTHSVDGRFVVESQWKTTRNGAAKLLQVRRTLELYAQRESSTKSTDHVVLCRWTAYSKVYMII